MLASVSRYGRAVQLMSYKLIRRALTAGHSVSRREGQLLGADLQASVYTYGISLSQGQGMTLPEGSGSLTMSFGSGSFGSDLPPGFVHPVSYFFGTREQRFVPVSTSDFPIVIALSYGKGILTDTSESAISLM